MRTFIYLTLLSTLLLATSCNNRKKEQVLPRISFKEYLNHTDEIAIDTDEIKHIEYVPLELTDDDASLVGHIQDIVLTEDYIYVLTLEEFKVFQFDRQGKYVRTITRQGNGPGELQSVGRTMWTDEAGEKIYISNGEGIQVFSSEGQFERQIKRGERLVSYAYGNGLDWVTEIATEYAPIDRSYFFGIGTFRYNADNSCDTLQLKKDFGDTSVVPLSETIFLNGRFMDCSDGYRYNVACNDTLFTISPEGIAPYLLLDRGPSSDEVKKYYFTHKNDVHKEMIYLQHACETPRHIYFRFFYNERFYILSYEKETHKILCNQTKFTFQNMKDFDTFMTCPGIENDVNGGLPIWFMHWNPEANIAVQTTSGATLAWMKEERMIKNLPDCLKDYPEDGNPVVAIYYFK
ncbi:MAG: 6-bladed beta-propeller [Bacteroidaceae bacterium]|nr:6-bladed beta-propeller [Bacteroidaceae bacterium]